MEEEFENLRGRVINLSKEERYFLKKMPYKTNNWFHLMIERAIKLEKMNIDIMKFLDDEIEKRKGISVDETK